MDHFCQFIDWSQKTALNKNRGVNPGRQIAIRYISRQNYGIVFLSSLIICWAASVYALDPGDAKASARVNLRNSPSLNGKILDTIPNGHSVRVIQTEGLWCRVDVAGEINGRGWVFARYLERISPNLPPADSPPRPVRIETSIKELPPDPPPVKLPPGLRTEAEAAKPVSTSQLKIPLTTGLKGKSSLQNTLRDAQNEPIAYLKPNRSPVAEPVYGPPVRSISEIISPAPHETKGPKTERRSLGSIEVALKSVSIVLYGLVVLLLYKEN